MVVKRRAFTLVETLVSLLVVLVFCQLAAVVVHHGVASRQSSELASDRFEWYLAGQQLQEYLHDKSIVGIEQGHGSILTFRDGTNFKKQFDFHLHQKNPRRWMLRKTNSAGGGHEPIMTGLVNYGNFTIINSRLIRLQVRLPAKTTREGVLYELDIPVAKAPAPGHDIAHGDDSRDALDKRAGVAYHSRRPTGPDMARAASRAALSSRFPDR
jgi:competence protein ComGF